MNRLEPQHSCFLPLLLAILLLGNGCLYAPPPAQDFISESDVRICMAHVLIDFLESPWIDEIAQSGRPVGTLILNLPQNQGAVTLKTDGGITRAFDLEREFIMPILDALQDSGTYGAFWKRLQDQFPNDWRQLCEICGKDFRTWQPPALKYLFFKGTTKLPEASSMYALNVTFQQTTKRIGDNSSIDEFRFMVHLVDIEKGEMVLSSVASRQHHWKRSFW